MTSSIARRRAAKAARRKVVVAAKRKIYLASSAVGLAARVRLAAGGGIEHCLMQQAMFESGMGTVILARQREGVLTLAGFLVDAFCLGVKDVFFQEIEPEKFPVFRDMLANSGPVTSVEPSHARKLLREAVAYARSLGFEPHRDFAAVEPIFGDIQADACTTIFQFGRDGKPYYVPGPNDTPAQNRQRLSRLYDSLGPEAFAAALDRPPLDEDASAPAVDVEN